MQHVVAALGEAGYLAALIPENSTLIMNIGTTTEAVARELLGHRNITVITNNMNVANILPGNTLSDDGHTFSGLDCVLVAEQRLYELEFFTIEADWERYEPLFHRILSHFEVGGD